MTLATTIRVNATTPFPSQVLGSGGLKISKANGIYTISPDFASLPLISSASDLVNKRAWVFDNATQIYSQMSLQAVVDATAQTGAGISIIYTFDTNTADADPGNGKLRLNSATETAATTIFVDLLDSAGMDWTTVLDSLDDSTNTIKGQISLTKVGDASKRIIADVSGSISAPAGYRKITITVRASNPVSPSSPFANGDSVVMQFVRAGDASAVTAGALAGGVWGDWTSVASAATTDIGALTTSLSLITGVVTITSLGTGANKFRVVRFAAALTLTHNAATLVLPGATNIVTAAGDEGIFVSDVSGNWRCVTYIRADGHDLTTLYSSALASAGTTDLGSVIARAITITGTTNITAFGSSAPTGAVKYLQFSGALTLTHNAVSLIIPGAGNVITAAGDVAIVRHEGSGNWRVMAYRPGASAPQTPIEATLASAATTDLGSVNADQVNVTGVVSITSLGTAKNRAVRVRFSAALVLTHNASTLILPGAVNIATAAGDIAFFVSDASGNWRLVGYTANAGFLGRMFTSAVQAITSAGSLTLAHGLGKMPELIQARLKCVTAEGNYSIGDEVMILESAYLDGSPFVRGHSIVPDATNINVRFTSTAGAVYQIANKTTGASFNITNANWNLIVRAFA